MKITTEQLENLIENFKNEKFGKNFKWRKNQKEIITDILIFYFNNPTGIYMLEAPTGSGKSIIAITVSGVLSKLDKTGYILTSDLALQRQYENDFRVYKTNWGSVKGIDNYICSVNGEKTSLGECHLKNLSIRDIRKLECFETCPYYSAREHAKRAPVSILNYAYWLIMQNYVKPRMNEPIFNTRDFTICDEAHKISNLVQNHFSPQISLKTIDLLINLRNFLGGEFQLKPKVSIDNFKDTINNIFIEQDEMQLFQLLKTFEYQLWRFVKVGNDAKDYIHEKWKNVIIPNHIRKGMNYVDRVKDLHCKIQDFVEIIDKTSPLHIVKSFKDDKITLKCVEENYMLKKYFHENTNFVLLMSATLGNEKTFVENINAGTRVYRFNKTHNNFSYEKSPIYVWKNIRMGRKEKEKNMPKVIEMTEKILEKHVNEKGIIHTSSYEITKNIYWGVNKNIKKRIFMYTDSQDKKRVLNNFEMSTDGVLIGPSILEGLDFYDDKSRFQIFAKVPYPSLGDLFVKRKMELKPKWYSWETIIQIEQGVGRSIRNSDDWAVTYFLDGCLLDLYKRDKSLFNSEFLNRLRIIK